MKNLVLTRRTLLAGASATSLLSLLPKTSLAADGSSVLNVIAFPEPPTLFIGLDQNGSTQTVAGKIYESLLTYDFDFTPRPSLAKSWEVSPDGLTYTFKLQEDAKWHDGKPFTADDVVFTTKEFLMEVHPRARVIFENCETIEALDPHTVRFVLKKPFAPFLMAFEMSTSPMIPAHLYKGTNYRTNPNNAKPIGTGPFKLADWQKGSFIRLVRNPDYHGEGEPHLDEMYFHILPDAGSRALALEQGRVQQTQFQDLEPFDVQRLASLPNIELITKGYEFYAPVARIEFNTRVKPFDDKRFRQAINYALDRKAILNTIFFSQGRVATGPLNSKTRFYDPDVTRYDYDLAKAKALLDDMGLKPDANGVRTQVKFLRLPWGETWARFAEYVKQSLGKVGIAVEIESADPAGWTSRYANWDFQMTSNYPYQFGDPALGVARFFVSSNIRKGVAYSNNTGYTNPRVDELFAAGASALSKEDRQKAYSEVQKILTEEVPMAWLVEVDFPTLLDKRFTDVVVSAIGVNETYRRARKVG
ncbi:ABC transporter substrate-binding protein [Microvirga roseola]|uniref:ABC transporter substrate-binding protein n=1 Tax=Microvirga roseola TaxID=2883126 RepID=UPI001E4314CE|nr:ABC transporter substrate-binding protein [Microvirga roseola]